MTSQNNFSKLLVQGGKSYEVEGLSMTNCDNADKLKWLGPRHNVVHDIDGSLSGTGVSTFIAPYEPHLE
jgi:hypothetical protein